jgi:holin-like protein
VRGAGEGLAGFLCILVFYAAGQWLAASLHLSVPGNVLGMLLLFLFLLARRGVPRAMDAVVPRLLGNMVLYFMPAAVGVMTLGPLLRQEGTGIVLAMVISTLVPLLLIGFGLESWLGRRQPPENGRAS